MWDERGDDHDAERPAETLAGHGPSEAPDLRMAAQTGIATRPVAEPRVATVAGPETPGAASEKAQTPAQTPALPPLDCSEPGAYFRSCREVLGLSLAEVTACTRIRDLDRIENERFDDRPPDPNLRGFLFEYARALGICDAEPLVRSFLERRQRERFGSA